MATPATKQTISPHLQRILDEHRKEAARLREKLGDPDEALSAFVREHFDREALEEAIRGFQEGTSLWDDNRLSALSRG